IPESGHKYYLQFSTEDYRTGEDAGNCLATVLYPKKKSPPVVSIKCSHTKDQKEIQEEDNRLYQRIRHQSKPITGGNIPGGFGRADPLWIYPWHSALIILFLFTPAQMRKDDFTEFDYTVLLHEMPSQEIVSCHMRLTWLPGRPLKVKHFCAAESHGADEGSGAESGSAAAPAAEKGANF
ncbi:OCX32 protein, partial [Leiothrix lutea]|nr:OCX32 protein [Leiothrix lutea]